MRVAAIAWALGGAACGEGDIDWAEGSHETAIATTTTPDSATGAAAAGPVVINGAVSPDAVDPSGACLEQRLDLRVLILAAYGDEPTAAAIRRTLDFLGTPYTVVVPSQEPPLTADRFWSGCRGFFQAVFLADGVLAGQSGDGAWGSTLAPEEWTLLRNYERAFGVREVSLYTYPTPLDGWDEPQAVGTDLQPLEVRLTAAGKALFATLAPEVALPVRYSWVYLSRLPETLGTPLIVDAEGHHLAVLRTLPDGLERLELTFDGNPWLTHATALGPGLVEWATRGLFIGEQHAFLSAQVDDLLIDNDLFTGGTYRIDDADFKALVAWQDARNRDPLLAGLRLDMAYNGEGASGIYEPDLLTDTASALEDRFGWINHTYTHLNLDSVTKATAVWELKKNVELGKSLGFELFSKLNFVSPDVSGLKNPAFLAAAYAEGIRFLICDTSVGCTAPVPNGAVPNPLEPRLTMLPRYPTNLFYNVSTPEEWVAEYNSFYRNYWGHEVSYAELLDKESNVLLGYLLSGDMNPLMFHQANLRAYDGVHSLLGDLIDATAAKYRQISVLPIITPTMNQLGAWMLSRTVLARGQLKATLVRGASNRLELMTTVKSTIPFTGVCSGNYEIYGGRCLTRLTIDANKLVKVSLP